MWSSSVGFTDVKTVLNSGNVVFTAPEVTAEKAAARIEAALPDALGISSKVTGLAADALATVVAENPLVGPAKDSPSRLMVVFLGRGADVAKLDGFAGQDWAPDKFGLGPRAAYMFCPQGLLVSRLAEAVARALGPGTTSRNWSTVMKLHALACR